MNSFYDHHKDSIRFNYRPTGLASGSICATFPRASARQKIRPNLTMIPGPRAAHG